MAFDDTEKQWYSAWYRDTYVPVQNELLGMWFTQVSAYLGKEIDPERRFDEALDYNEFMTGIWHKYMQVCLYEYAQQKNVVAMTLDESY